MQALISAAHQTRAVMCDAAFCLASHHQAALHDAAKWTIIIQGE